MALKVSLKFQAVHSTYEVLTFINVSDLMGIIVPIPLLWGTYWFLFHFLWSEKNYPVDRNTCN
jgi:hypothetical protein